MGISFHQGRTRFRISPENEEPALAALHASDGDLAEAIQGAQSLDEALSRLGWRVYRNEGYISGLRATDSRLRWEFAMFDALAPHVRSGSSIVLTLDTDPSPVIHWFDGKTRTEETVRRDDPKFDVLVEEPQYDEPAPVKAALTWSDVRTSQPNTLKPYKPSETFVEGEWIAHVKLGPGLVVAIVEKTKVRILFEAGEKLLAQGMTL